MINMNDVVDTKQFADMLGIKPKTVVNYLSRERQLEWANVGNPGAFPKPVAYISERFPVWDRQEAEDYAAGRPGSGSHDVGDARVARFMQTEQAAAVAG